MGTLAASAIACAALVMFFGPEAHGVSFRRDGRGGPPVAGARDSRSGGQPGRDDSNRVGGAIMTRHTRAGSRPADRRGRAHAGTRRAGALAATPCEALRSLPLPHATITEAESRPAGKPSRPRATRLGTEWRTFQPCVGLRPRSRRRAIRTSEIEVWLPESGWNGKFQAVGNGGWAGSINYAAMAEAIRHGYATSSTDTGHVGSTAAFAFGHPEKLTDFGYRAVHEMAVKAKRSSSPSTVHRRGSPTGTAARRAGGRG